VTLGSPVSRQGSVRVALSPAGRHALSVKINPSVASAPHAANLFTASPYCLPTEVGTDDDDKR
jgi:hypothetical protein